jgi:hypothetical protein
MKNAVFWVAMSCDSCNNHISEVLSASIIKLTRIGEIGTTLAVTSNRITLRRNTVVFYINFYLADSCHPDDGGGMFLRNVGSYKSHSG